MARRRRINLGSSPGEHASKARTFYTAAVAGAKRAKGLAMGGRCTQAVTELVWASKLHGQYVAHVSSAGRHPRKGKLPAIEQARRAVIGCMRSR